MIPSTVPTVIPTVNPTTVPSVIPTAAPTFRPTTTPTYNKSVRIYVIILQELIGILSSEYDQVEYNQLLVASICASIPYTTDPQDVTILSIQPYSQTNNTRRLENTTDSGVLVTYAISIESNLFSSSISGIIGVVDALNDSITTGFFDDNLHRDAHSVNATALETVVSRLHTFQTGSPTSSPTSFPSSHPTSLPTLSPTPFDVIGTNIFNTDIDNKVVAVRVKFYLGTYIGYFLVLFVLLMLIDKSEIAKKLVKELEMSAFESAVYNSPNQLPIVETETKVEAKCSRMNQLIEENIQFRNSLSETDSWKLKRQQSEGEKYTPYFHNCLFHQRCLLGCKPIFYPDGMPLPLGCATISLPPGLLEDFMLFLCNNNTFFNCLFTIKGGKISRSGNRYIYILSNCVAFFLNCICGSVLNYLEISEYGSIAFDIIVISPSVLIVSNIVEQLYSCPIAESEAFQARFPSLGNKLRYIGRFMILPFMVASFALLVLSAIFSKGADSVYIIGMFILQVQMQAFILEIILTIMLFVPNYHWKFSVYTPLGDVTLVEIGMRYVESILLQGLLEGKDYVSFSQLYLNIFRLEYCYSYEDALRKGLISLPSQNITDDSFEMSSLYDGDVEYGEASKSGNEKMSSRGSVYRTSIIIDTAKPNVDATDLSDKAVDYTNSTIYKGSSNKVIDNPLHASAYLTTSDKDVLFSTNTIYSGKLNEITENPLHRKTEEARDQGSIVRVSYGNIYNPSDGSFVTDTTSVNVVMAEEIMTEELRAQYNDLTEEDKASFHNTLKNELHLNDAQVTRVVACSTHSDSSLSIGWKKATNMFRIKPAQSSLESLKRHVIKEIKRKDFKNKGLRGSFVNNYRFFEEKEQTANSKPALDAVTIRAKGIHAEPTVASTDEE